MSLMGALAMIGQDLDHAAFADTAMRALVKHPPHLGPKGGEPRDLALDLRQVATGDHVGFRAWSLGLVG